MRQMKNLVYAMVLAAVTCLSFTNGAWADSEAGFIMVGSGTESGGYWGAGGSSESGGYKWGDTESGGPTDTGAESDSGGVLQSEARSESGGATDSGAESQASVGGNETTFGRYVQYYGR